MATTFPGNNAPVSQQSGWYTRLKEIRKTYAFRVILQGILTAWAATTFTFFLVRLLPGDPISIETDRLMQQGYTADEAANIAATLFRYDPSVPVWQQYLQYMANLLQGDLGQSIKSAGTEVNAIILRFSTLDIIICWIGIINQLYSRNNFRHCNGILARLYL